MYRYQFGKFRDEDAVSFCDADFPKISPGTLIQVGESLYLCLGESISRPELTPGRSHLLNPTILCQLCHSDTIAMIHRMVNERYSSYHDILPLFFGSDIHLLLKYKPKGVKGEKGKVKSVGKKDCVGQKLEIFPSLFALMGNNREEIAKDHLNSKRERGESIIYNLKSIISGTSTPVQRAKAYRDIQSGQITHVSATHSQIFRDRSNLGEIILHDPDSSFYTVYQEPRYKIQTIVEEMKSIYNLKS